MNMFQSCSIVFVNLCVDHTGSLSVVSEIGQEESLSVNDVDTI